MILKMKEPFAGYHIVRMLTSDNMYREVYEAEEPDGEKVFLTVYDDRENELLRQEKNPREFMLVIQLNNKMFPEYLDHGAMPYGDHTVYYMSTEYFDGMTVREAVEKKMLNTEDALQIAHQLVIGLRELLYHTQGGGHYNICPDTVLLSKDGKGKMIPHIVGLDHVSGPCNGKTEFITATLNACCRAPETFLGKFSSATDVYSMGMLLGFMLKGCYPYAVVEDMSTQMIHYVKKHMDDLELTLDIPEGLKSIIIKAVNKNAMKRYKDILEFGIALTEYLGLEIPDRFRCLSDDNRRNRNRKNREDDTIQNDENWNIKDDTRQSGPTPCVDVSFSTRKGEEFDAVAGMEDIKHQLHRDFVEIVSNRELAKEYGILPPNMLFYGPPGVGKTYICERLAEECHLEVCAIKPSDLGSIWVHGSQSLIKQLFNKAEETARKNKKGVILMVDEMDALCGKRDAKGNEHQADEVAEWLVQLNHCVEKNVYVIGTTNCIDRIDPAIIRKGRIDQVVYIGLPDEECRRQLFELELTKRPHENINMEELARLTQDFTCSDITYVVKQGARRAFEASLNTGNKRMVKISEEMLKDIIAATRPSVSHENRLRYERMWEEYEGRTQENRPRIGFQTYG